MINWVFSYFAWNTNRLFSLFLCSSGDTLYILCCQILFVWVTTNWLELICTFLLHRNLSSLSRHITCVPYILCSCNIQILLSHEAHCLHGNWMLARHSRLCTCLSCSIILKLSNRPGSICTQYTETLWIDHESVIVYPAGPCTNRYNILYYS